MNNTHGGLSPSSLATYLGCNRRYWHRKIAKTKVDADVEDDVESLQVGKAFHKVLEDCRHELDGVTYSTVAGVVEAHGLDANALGPLVFAMLAKYKSMHAAAGLKAHACEVEVETPTFFGIVDVVLLDDDGSWWIGDMKTSAAYYSNIVATLPKHPQLNLYAAHAAVIAEKVGLALAKYQGCRYRLTTKSKLIRKATESVGDYVGRVTKAIKSIDFIVPRGLMAPEELLTMHFGIKSFIDANKEAAAYPPNFGNCMSYFRPCEFWSNCHGKCNSEMMTLESVEG